MYINDIILLEGEIVILVSQTEGLMLVDLRHGLALGELKKNILSIARVSPSRYLFVQPNKELYQLEVTGAPDYAFRVVGQVEGFSKYSLTMKQVGVGVEIMLADSKLIMIEVEGVGNKVTEVTEILDIQGAGSVLRDTIHL